MNKAIKIHGISLPSNCHTLISGQPGAGKTTSILRPLLKGYLSQQADRTDTKAGMLMLDPKGDMVGWTREVLAAAGREDDLIVVGEGNYGFNLFSAMPLSPMQAAQRLSNLANSLNRVTQSLGDQEYWGHQQRQILEALIQVAQIQRRDEMMKIADVVSLRFKLLPQLKGSIEQFASKYHLDEIPDVKRVLKDFANLPNDTRECVLSTVANCLSVFAQEPLCELMNPTPAKNVDLAEIIEKGKCVVVSCTTRSYGNATLPLIQSVKEAFADLILSRSEIEIEDRHGFRKLNSEREILYVSDEVHRVLRCGNDGGELDFLDMCREFKCRALFATQSLSSLQSVMGVIPATRLVSLIGNHFMMNNIDPASGDWADRIFKTENQELPPALLRPSSHYPSPIDWDGPQTLARLQVGEFLLRTNNAKIYRKRASLKRDTIKSKGKTK